ncbi:hypothetical protein RhiJN_28973 [Ceratobasidium sp. AG-Ba]|nr:hypothetical protein RhiJN_28973 [Ceratobasidium sp. AG-Ba]
MKLVFMIHGRYETPLAELEHLDLAKLEEYWKNGPPKKPVQTKGKSKASNPAPKLLAAKTPAKGVRASKVAVSQVTMIGSPLVVWKEAQEEAARAEYTPVPKKRTRDLSVESAGEPRRLLDPKDVARGSTKSQPSSRTVSSTSTRAGSAVPTIAPSRSKSSVPPAPPSRRPTEEPEDKNFDIETTQGADEDQPDEVEVKPKKKRVGKKSNEDAKPQAKRGNYKDDGVTTMIIDRAHEETLVYFRLDMCAGPDEISLMIHKGWAKAVKHCQQPAENWQLDGSLTRVIKSLVYGFRSRARQRLTRSILSYFGLELSAKKSIEDVKEIAANLLPTKFHRDPKAKHEDEGNYQSPIISRGIANIWYTGTKPTAFQFPNSMDPIPTESIAYVAALTHDILNRVAKDGLPKPETRSGGDSAEQEGVADKKGGRANIDPVKALMTVHLGNLRTFEKADAEAYDDFLADLRTATLKCVGKSEDEPNRSDKEPLPGVLSAASFAGEKRYIATRTRPTSGNSAQGQPKPRPQPKPCPLQSTTKTAVNGTLKIAHINEQSDDEDILRDTTPVAAHDKETTRGKPPGRMDEEMGEVENGRLEGKAQSPRAVASDVDEDDEGSGEVRDSVRANEASKKRKPPVGEGGQQEHSAAEKMAEDELPVKRPRLTRRSIIQDSGSDDEGEDGAENGSEDPNNKGAGGELFDVLPNTRVAPSVTVPGTPKQSSPLSTPDPSPVVSKRETRSSKQAGKGGQTLEVESAPRMASAPERRKTATKKHEREATAREDELQNPQEEINKQTGKQSKKARKK